MPEGIRVDIGGRSAHEDSLLEIQRDLLPRQCSSSTPVSVASTNIATLASHASALGIKHDTITRVNYNEIKGRVLNEIINKLSSSEKRRYDIAKQQMDLFGGGEENETEVP